MTSISLSSTVVPGPRPVPLLGWHGNSFGFLRDPIGYMQQVYDQYGAIAGLARGASMRVFAFAPEHNRLMLNDPDHFHTIFESITSERLKRRRRGIGLLNMNGPQHKQQRRLMMPAFHRRAVEGYRDEMVRITQQVLERLPRDEVFDVAGAMQQLTLRVAAKTLFGLEMGEQAQGLGLLIKQLLATPFFSPVIALFPVNVSGTPYHRMLQLSDRLDDEMLALIARKRAASREDGDVLAMLIAARDEDGTGMTDVELLGQATTLLIAGHETSSNALTWTLFLLDQHPEVLAAVVDELDGVLHGDAPTVAQLNQLPLLERVIKESMRLLPPASLMSREAQAPFQLGPYQLPKGAFVMWSPYITHRIAALYSQPQHFLPQRWETIDPSSYEYIPFGAGPRMCIGMTFALMEIKIVLALLLQHLRFQLAPGTTVNRELKITLAPKGGLPMTAVPQDRRFRASVVDGNIHQMVQLR
jgi:cytochrome P450